jgi:hypothetical protein
VAANKGVKLNIIIANYYMRCIILHLLTRLPR